MYIVEREQAEQPWWETQWFLNWLKCARGEM